MTDPFFTDKRCGSRSPKGRTCRNFWAHGGCCSGVDAGAPPGTKASERWWDADAVARQDPPVRKMFRAGIIVPMLPGASRSYH